jgi:hypothetical protein
MDKGSAMQTSLGAMRTYLIVRGGRKGALRDDHRAVAADGQIQRGARDRRPRVRLFGGEMPREERSSRGIFDGHMES